jgi:hypothetical protein
MVAGSGILQLGEKAMRKIKIAEVEDRLNKDEGAWLKSLGELGDMARMLLKCQQDQIENTKTIIALEKRIQKLEGRQA